MVNTKQKRRNMYTLKPEMSEFSLKSSNMTVPKPSSIVSSTSVSLRTTRSSKVYVKRDPRMSTVDYKIKRYTKLNQELHWSICQRKALTKKLQNDLNEFDVQYDELLEQKHIQEAAQLANKHRSVKEHSELLEQHIKKLDEISNDLNERIKLEENRERDLKKEKRKLEWEYASIKSKISFYSSKTKRDDSQNESLTNSESTETHQQEDQSFFKRMIVGILWPFSFLLNRPNKH